MAEPVTFPLGIAAVALHEVYITYINAGFSEDQAFELVKILFTKGIMGGKNNDISRP